MSDVINHPAHYNNGPKHSVCGETIETIDISETYSSNVGQAIQYLMRHELKNGAEDLRKAAWFAIREAERLERLAAKEAEVENAR